MSALLVLLVRAYQYTFAAILGGQCRFAPSCSEYAIGAIRARGAVGGSALAVGRILRCNPWNPGGYDPPPICACAVAPGRMHGNRTGC